MKISSIYSNLKWEASQLHYQFHAESFHIPSIIAAFKFHIITESVELEGTLIDQQWFSCQPHCSKPLMFVRHVLYCDSSAGRRDLVFQVWGEEPLSTHPMSSLHKGKGLPGRTQSCGSWGWEMQNKALLITKGPYKLSSAHCSLAKLGNDERLHSMKMSF